MARKKTQRRTRAARRATEAARTIRKLLRQNPLRLAELQHAIASHAGLASSVLRAAAAEQPVAPDLESAIVLLGAEGIRMALARSANQAKLSAKRQRRRKASAAPTDTAMPPATAERIRVLRAALARNVYRIDPKNLAAAMLRELERS
jgi:anti-sigma28 factor (negative regulator of flagellin synthesis)